MRVAGVNLPPKKRIEIALTYIYGIGISASKSILNKLNIILDTKVIELTQQQLLQIQNELKEHTIEGDLRREIQLNIKRLSDINCYRARRRRRGLPLRGQRTKTNGRTNRGRKRTIANKKIASK
jgi:small subunit ribosomal protein S13